MKNKHLVIVSYDGVATHYCGVGTIIRNTVQSLLDISIENQLKVSIAYIAVDPTGPVFNQECFDQSKKLTELTGGHLIALNNGTEGQTEWDMWSSFEQWKLASESNQLVSAII